MFEDFEKMIHKGLTRYGREYLYSYYLGIFEGSVSSRLALEAFKKPIFKKKKMDIILVLEGEPSYDPLVRAQGDTACLNKWVSDS